MSATSIEWTDVVWNPTRGCERVSPGCGGGTPHLEGTGGCYAERQAYRFSGPGMPYEGLVRLGKNGPRWTGVVRLHHEMLAKPVSWCTPTRIFVNSMSDLFASQLSDHDIDQVFGAMWACLYVGRGEAIVDGHVFQILTKRADRMRDYMNQNRRRQWADAAVAVGGGKNPDLLWDQTAFAKGPHPRIWLGVSVENQKYADERIPHLLATPAAVHWISAEPLLGPVDLTAFLHRPRMACDGCTPDGALCAGHEYGASLDWVIVGSESGPGARAMDIAWARSIVDQCVAAGVPIFTKQISNPKDRKGGNPEYWPPGDWPRQMPEARS